jgi:regulator of RNase E activity RraA
MAAAGILDDPLLGQLRSLDACAVSDALDAVNLPGATIGLRPLWPGLRVVGRCLTVQIVPRSDVAPSVHLNTPAVEAGGPGDVIVIANGGRTDVSCWGDILANAAATRGIEGVVIDGACRDIDACAEIGFPVYGRAVVPVSARGRIVQGSFGDPVMMAGVRVARGDLVIADGSGAVFVPQARAAEVIDRAMRLAARQARMVAAVRGGRSVVDVMHDREFDAALAAEAQA